MSIIDLCALIEYQTKLRCLIEADLDTPFDYDEVRYLLEDYGYDMPKEDNKILDKAFQITENLISGLENDIKIFKTLTNEEKLIVKIYLAQELYKYSDIKRAEKIILSIKKMEYLSDIVEGLLEYTEKNRALIAKQRKRTLHKDED